MAKIQSMDVTIFDVGLAAGGTMMYQAMTSLGFAADSGYAGPVKLQGNPKGATVLILGAGLAGMSAAYELRKAGYKVQILEYNARPGGRNWTLRGGDTVTATGVLTWSNDDQSVTWQRITDAVKCDGR